MKRAWQMILLYAAVSCSNAASLKSFGYLGQSQPDGSMPLSQVASSGTVNDSHGNLLFFNGRNLYLKSRGEQRISLITDMGGRLLSDGQDVFRQHAGGISVLKMQNGSILQEIPLVKFNHSFKSIGIAEKNTKKRFGGRCRFAGLDSDGKKVFGWDASGRSLGVLVDLSHLRLRGKIESIGIMPGSGYLLIAVFYPDAHIYRIDEDGKIVNGGKWPMRYSGGTSFFALVNGRIWFCGSNAVCVDDRVSAGENTVVGDSQDFYIRGIAADGEAGYFLATTQGLKHYPASDLRECDYRLGGIGRPSGIALANGRMIAVDGYSINCLSLDDFPDSALQNTGNEIWHVGSNWSSVGCAVIPDGRRFLILDSRHRKLWRFDPEKNEWPWKGRMTDTGYALKDPRDLAYAGDRLVIVDQGRLNVPTDLKEKISRVDAFNENEIVAADGKSVFYLRNGKTAWRRAFPVRDIAVIGDFLVAAGLQEMQLWDKEGKIVSKVPVKASRLAVSGRWLVAADYEKYALRRYKLIYKSIN